MSCSMNCNRSYSRSCNKSNGCPKTGLKARANTTSTSCRSMNSSYFHSRCPNANCRMNCRKSTSRSQSGSCRNCHSLNYN